MRILCVAPSYWPAFQYGGPIFVTHYLNVALVKRGIDVTVYTTSVGLTTKVPENVETDVDGVRVIYFSITRMFEVLGATGWQFSWRLSKALRDNIGQFDVVHINAIWNYPAAAAAFFSRTHGVPYLVTPHGALYSYALLNRRWRKLLYYHSVANKLLSKAAAIHYTCADELERCHFPLSLKSEAVVAPPVIDLSDFMFSFDGRELTEIGRPDNRRKTILFLSRLNRKKGLDILIRAFAIVAKRQVDVHLLIAGNDESGFAGQVKKWIREEGMTYDERPGGSGEPLTEGEARITLIGMLTGKSRVHAYARSDVFVLPSYSENFGVVVVEAMACGVPVIISDQVGIHKEVAASKAGVVIGTDARQLADAITGLLRDAATRREMGRNGQRAVAERFAPIKAADKMVEIYRQVLKRVE